MLLLDDDATRRARLRGQCLDGPPPSDVPWALARAFALQSQEHAAARLGLRARTQGVDDAEVRRAGDEERSVVRTWAMRGTLHLLPAVDVRWVVALLGPRVLADGPLRRSALVAALVRRGVPTDPTGEAPAHLVAYAALHGAICRAADTPAGEPTFALLDDCLAGTPPRAPGEPLVELARRHLRAYGPSRPDNLACGRASASVRRARRTRPWRASSPRSRPPAPAAGSSRGRASATPSARRSPPSGCCPASTPTCSATAVATSFSPRPTPPASRPGAASSTRPSSPTAWQARYLDGLRRQPGLGKVKLERTSTQGLFLEVPVNTAVPHDWTRRGGLQKVERYSTAALEEHAIELAEAEATVATETQAIFARLRTEAAAVADEVRDLARFLGRPATLAVAPP